MTKIVPSQTALVIERSAVTLARYAAIIRYPECAFWGVTRDGDAQYQCRLLWTKAQRDMLARYLGEAQIEIENEIGYFLMPRYVVGRLADEPNGSTRYVDDQTYLSPISARWPRVIAAGVRAEANISLGAAVSHVADPAVIGPIATTVTDPAEIYVYHPGSDVEINPSDITIAGGNVTITVPRCRMVKESLAGDDSGIDYTVTANFEQTVDVKRVYTDAATNAELVSPHQCNPLCDSQGCSEQTITGCIYLVDGLLGHLAIRPATYSAGAWATNSYTCCRALTRARLNYLAGEKDLTPQAEDAIVRLAHSKMPQEPCGCEVGQWMWKRDRHTPEILTRERINCRFGMSDGAWTAWQFALDMKQWRGSVI